MKKRNLPVADKVPKEVVEALQAVIRQEVGDFKSTVKGEIIQLSDRVDELTEQYNDGKRGEARLLLTQKLYQTDRKEILEVSRISPLSGRAYAIALTLDAQTSPEVQSGEVSLVAIKIDYELRLNLSKGGFNRGMSMPALVEQVGATQAEEGRMEEIEAGGRRQ